MTQIGTGAFDLTKGSLRLGLLVSTYGLGLLRTLAERQFGGPTEQAAPEPVAEIIAAVPASGRGKTVLRLGLAAAVIAALGAAVAIIARNRCTTMPEPAAEPPSLRAATNGGVQADKVTVVEDF